MIVQVSDFIGKYALSKGMFSEQTIQDYIDRYQNRYLKELFGVKLYDQFELDLLNDVPQSPNFIKVFEAFSEDINLLCVGWNRGYRNEGMLISNGIKDMLLGFIYYEYCKDLVNQMTPFGNTKPQSENSDVANTLFSTMYNRYNESIISFQAIQDYIILNQSLVTGQLVDFTLTTAGTGYVDGTFNLIGGSGAGGTALITTSGGMGHVNSITFSNVGSGYVVGDVLTVDSGDINATITLTYVGIGNFSLFNGRKKLTAYWL
tara:strand:+ start:8505 stop:9287 length:783 start_codon:yes stop_codon:yes gene_type:complete